MGNEKWGNYTQEFTLGHDAEEIKNAQAILNRTRSCTDFSPAARYAVQRLVDYSKQEHELREKAETILCNERRKALAFSAEMARQERTIDDLRQQLSFMQQAMQDTVV